MERGWVWNLMGADSELWPPRCFSQNPSLVHRSPGLSSFPGEAARSLPSVRTRSYVGSRILPALHMPQSHFLRQSFRKWSPSHFYEITSGILFTCSQPVLRCDCDRTPRSPRAHQRAPAQRENLPSSPPSVHMEMSAPGTAQEGLLVDTSPGVSSSRWPGVTLGALLVKDQKHPG